MKKVYAITRWVNEVQVSEDFAETYSDAKSIADNMMEKDILSFNGEVKLKKSSCSYTVRHIESESKTKIYVKYYKCITEDEVNDPDKITFRKKLGMEISRIRQEKGYTVRQLAPLCGVTYQNINKIELGKYNASIDIINKIASALECELKIISICQEQ